MRSDAPPRTRYALPRLLAALLAVAACSDQSEIGPGQVETVRVDPDSVALLLGGTDTLQAFPIDVRGSFLPGKQVSWTSSAPGIASVTEAGEITGLAVGMATITATVGQVSGSAKVTVVPAPTIGASSIAIQLDGIGSSGVNPTDTVVISNVGGAVLDELAVGTISYGAGATDWLTAVLDQGSAPANLELIASVTGLPLGSYTATVPVTEPDATNTPLNLTVTLTVSADAAATLAPSAGDNQTGPAGSAVAIAPAVQVNDQFGNPVAGVQVTFAVASGGGSLTGASATSGANGIATVGSWTLGTATGSNTLTATAPGLTGSPVTFTAIAAAGNATQVIASAGTGQSAVAGQPVAVPPAVLVTDQFANPVPNATVTFAVASGGGSVTGGSASTNASGIATVGSWTLGTTAGSNSLTATVAGLTPVTFTATGTAGAAASLTIQAGNNQSATVGSAVAIPPSVRVTDANANPVGGVAVTFAAASGGGSLTGGTATTNAAGIATVGSWTLGTTAGPNTLSGSSAGLTPVLFTATGLAGAPASLTIQAGNGQTAAAGSAVPIAPAVRVTDQNANPVSGVSVTFAVTAGGGSVTGGSAVTNASGIATVGSWILGPAVGTGNNAVQASVAGLSSVGFTASATAAPAVAIAVFAGNAQTATAGTAVGTNPAVRVTDQFGNPVSGVAVTFAVSGGGGSVTGGSPTTNALGVATVGSWTLGQVAGANSLTATSTGLTGSPVAFTATGTAGAASQIAVNAGNGQSAPAGSPVPVAPSVRVADQFGNAVAGVSVTFAVATGGGSATGTSATTSASGIATVGSWTLGATSGSNTLTATSAGLTGSPVTFTATGTAGAATTLAKNAGDNQAATVGTAVATAPRVLVTDANGNPVAGVAVTFSVTGGGGSVTGGATTTNASGLATIGSWTLGTVAGTGNNTLQVSASGIGTTVTFTASASAGAAASVAVSAGNGQVAVVGTALPVDPAVLVTDQFSNPVSGASVTFAVATGGGSVTGAGTVTNASGVAAVGSWTLGTTAGSNSLTATVVGLAPASFTATGIAGAAASVAVNAGDGQSAGAGSPVAVAPSVIVRDAFNNAVSGVSVTFAVATGGGSATGTGATTNASGIATVGSWTLGTTAGSNSLTATVAGITPVTFTATGTSGGAASIALNAGNGQTATVNTAVATAPSVIVRDGFSNPVAGVSVTFAVATGGGAVTGASATTNASGIATVGSWTLGQAAGSNTLTASSAGLTGSPVTFTATGTAGAATQISASAGNGQSATVGTAVPIEPVVLVRDAFGNPVGGVGVTFAVGAGGGSLTGGNATSNASGLATVGSWTLGTTAGNNSLTATSAGLTGSPVSFTATGTAGAATQIAASAGNGQSAVAGSAVAVAPAVLVRDQFNNPVAGASVTFAVATGGGSATGTSASSNASGIATVGSWTLGTTAGSNSLTATSGALTPVTFTATGTAGPAALLVKTAGDNQAATVSTAVPVPPAVTVTDANGNQVGAGVSVTFAVATGGGSATGTSASTNASGVATVGSWTLGPTAGANNNTLNASSSGLPTVTFTATANSGSATTIVQGTGNGQTGTVGTLLGTPLTATVTDGANPVAGFGVSWAAAGGGSVNCGAGAVPNCTATTDVNGVSSVTWTLGPIAGSQNATGSAGGLSGSPVTFTATATAAAAATIAANAGNGQSATVGTAVGTDPSVLVTDAFGNPVGGVGVTFAVASGGGNASGASTTTNASGIATVGSWTLGQTAGSNTLTATSTGLTGSPVTFTATGTAGAAASVAISVGDGQSAPVGSALATDPSVVVRDAFNNLVSGASVTFAVASGGGSVTGSPALTNASGIATLGSWTLGTTAGTNTLTATVGALTPVTFTATGTPAGAAVIALNGGNAQTATVGTAVTTDPSVLVTDPFGNPVSGIAVTFAVSGGGGSVTGGSASTNASGIATVGSWTLGTTAGANTLTATSTGLTGSPVTFTATGTAGAATQIALSTGNGQTAAAGSPVAIAPAVIVRDAFNNPKSGVSVTFSVTAGGGNVSGASTTTNASGIATVGSWTLGPTAGTSNNTLQATSTGLTGSPVSFTASATAAVAANVAIAAGNGQSATVGTAVATDPSVVVTDAFGNLVSGATVTFVAQTGGGSVVGGSQISNASGVATVGSWTLGTTAGANTLTATVGALTPATFTATGLAGAATTVAVSAGNNQSATVGTAVAIDPAVLVSDQFGNPVSGVSVSFAVTGGGGSVTGSSQSTNASGIATVTSWTLGTLAGANSLGASVTGLTPAGFTATGTAGAAAAATTTAAVPSGTAGALTTITITSRDQFGNLRTSGGASIAVSVSGANSATPAVTDNGNGSYTASYTPSASGTDNVAITLGGVAISGSPYSSVVSPAAAASIAVNLGNGQSATVGTAVATAPSVIVRDAFSNPVSGVNVTFAVVLGGGGATGTSTTTNASGIATVGSWTLGTTAGTNTLTATSAGLTGSPVTFTATGTAGAAANIAKSAGDNQSATVNTAVTTDPSVRVTDAFGNNVAGVNVTFSVTGGGGSVVPVTAIATNASGLATVTSWTLGTTAGTNNLQATASVGSVTFTATGTAGTATQIAINAGNGQTATVNTAVGVDPSVVLRDAFNNLVSGATVTFVVTAGGGSVTGGTAVSNASGIATVTSWTLGTTAGSSNNTLQATSATAGSVNFTASATAGAATQIAVNTGNGQTATVNTAVAVDPSVLVRDAFNNPVSGVAVTFSVFAGGGSLTGASQTTNASGIATVTSWTLGTVAGTSNNTLRAASTGLTGSPVSFTASATAGAAANMTLVQGNNQTGTVNTTLPIDPSVRITDVFGNNVSGTVVTWNHTSTSGTINCSGTSTTTSCTVTSGATGLSTLISQVLGTVAGTNTVTATATGLSGSPITFASTGTAGAVATLTRNSTNNQTARPNATVASDPSVIATDAFGNVVAGATVTFTVTNATGPGEVTCVLIASSSCSETTNASGVATIISWRLSVSGVPTSTAPAGGDYTNTLSVTSGSGSTTFSANAAWSFALDVGPIFTSNSQGSCDGCHSAGNFSVRSNIVNRAAIDNPGCGSLVVTTGSLANSFLYQKIQHTQSAGCGGSMPAVSGLPFLTSTERNKIRDWILNLAPNN